MYKHPELCQKTKVSQVQPGNLLEGSSSLRNLAGVGNPAPDIVDIRAFGQEWVVGNGGADAVVGVDLSFRQMGVVDADDGHASVGGRIHGHFPVKSNEQVLL